MQVAVDWPSTPPTKDPVQVTTKSMSTTLYVNDASHMSGCACTPSLRVNRTMTCKVSAFDVALLFVVLSTILPPTDKDKTDEETTAHTQD